MWAIGELLGIIWNRQATDTWIYSLKSIKAVVIQGEDILEEKIHS